MIGYWQIIFHVILVEGELFQQMRGEGKLEI